MPAFGKNVSDLSRSEIYGILRHDRPFYGGRPRVSLIDGGGCFVWSIPFSGYPFKRRMSSNRSWCFVVVVSVECLSSIRFRLSRMKSNFDFLGIGYWRCTNSGFLAAFYKSRSTFRRLWRW